MARKHEKKLKRRPRAKLPHVFVCPSCRKATLHVSITPIMKGIRGLVKCTSRVCGLQQAVILLGKNWHAVDVYSFFVDILNGDSVPESVVSTFKPLREVLSAIDEPLRLEDAEVAAGVRSDVILREVVHYDLELVSNSGQVYLMRTEPVPDYAGVEDAEVETIIFKGNDARYSVTEKTLTIKVGEEAYLMGKRKLIRRFLKRQNLDPKKWLRKDPTVLERTLNKKALPKYFELTVQNSLITKVLVRKNALD